MDGHEHVHLIRCVAQKWRRDRYLSPSILSAPSSESCMSGREREADGEQNVKTVALQKTITIKLTTKATH